MQRKDQCVVLALLGFALLLAACAPTPAVKASNRPPAKVERIAGTKLNRVQLVAEAAKRLDIKTAPVRDTQVNGVARKVVPYAAVLYDPQGNTWTYTSPEALQYVRQLIKIDFIDGELAVLSDGPPAGMAVVTVGVSELYGIEFGVGK